MLIINSAYRVVFVLVLFLVCAFGLTAQIVSSIKINRDSVQIGDTVTVEVKVIVPDNITIKGLDFSGYRNIENKVYLNDTLTMERYADLEILDFGAWKHQDMTTPVPSSALQITKSNGKQIITNTITIAIYNPGKFNISGPDVTTEDKGEILPSESPVLSVFLPPKLMKQDTIAFNPIKDIIQEEADLSDYLVYLYILGAILILGIIGYYFYNLRRKKEEVETPIAIPVLPAHEKALGALKDLDKKQLWQNGWIKEYQSGLTDIIRTYLEERYGVPAPEMTTDEISQALNTAELASDYVNTLRDILQIADLVKFAKATPENDVNSRFMDMAVDFVENTKAQG